MGNLQGKLNIPCLLSQSVENLHAQVVIGWSISGSDYLVITVWTLSFRENDHSFFFFVIDLFFGVGMIEQGGSKLETRTLNLNTWKKHLRHLIGLFVFTRSSHQITGGEISHSTERRELNCNLES